MRQIPRMKTVREFGPLSYLRIGYKILHYPFYRIL